MYVTTPKQLYLLPQIMETLHKKQQQQSISKLIKHLIETLNLSSPKTRTQELPQDLISAILSRLPIKTLLRFRSVSKPWLSLISEPSFAKLHFIQSTADHRVELLISAYDTWTRQRYFLSAPPNGGPVIHIFTLPTRTITNKETTEMEHLNGLVLFTSGNGFVERNFGYVINPSTRKMFKLIGPGSEPGCLRYGEGYICYFFGFDERRNEHKVLTIRMFYGTYDQISNFNRFDPIKVEVMIFSMSDLTWRKIDFEVCSCIIRHWDVGTKHSVCVDSVIHVILQNRGQILSFDLRNEKFSVMSIPVDAIAFASRKRLCKKGLNSVVTNYPFLMKINGYLGLMCHHPEVEVKEMDVWILKDYERRLWVRETVGFSRSWFVLDGPFALNPFIKKDVLETQKKISVLMYDVERKSAKFVDFALGYEFLHSKTVRFDHVRSYTESILPLPKN